MLNFPNTVLTVILRYEPPQQGPNLSKVLTCFLILKMGTHQEHKGQPQKGGKQMQISENPVQFRGNSKIILLLSPSVITEQTLKFTELVQ